MTSGNEWSGVAGKRVLITGATSGIGLAAARELARRGAHVALAGRSRERADAAASRVRAGARADTQVDVLLADLSTQEGVRALAAQALGRYPALHALVNNAGAVNASRTFTADGIELTWAVNHLAPYLLTNLLLERLRESAPARVVTTSSNAHLSAQIPFEDFAGDHGYGPIGLGRYGQSKLANILFTRELARRLEGSGVLAYSFHPGLVATGFNRNNGPLMRFGMTLTRPFSRTPEKGADTLVWLLDAVPAPAPAGGYFHDRRPGKLSAAAQDDAAARRLWEVSAEQTGLKPA